MARRSRGGDIDFSGYYNEPEINPISMAMQLLGMESKSQESEADRLMSFMQMRAQQKQAEEALGLQREQFGETRESGRSARELAKAQEERLGRAATAQQEIERQKVLASALEKTAGLPTLSPEARLLLKNISGMEKPFTEMEQQQELATFRPQLEAAYATPNAAKRDAAIKLLYGKMSPYARENVGWQDLNQALPPEKPGFFSRFRGGNTTPTPAPSSGEYVPEWQTGVSVQPQYAPEWQQQSSGPSVPGGYPLGAEVEQPGMINKLLELLTSDKSARFNELPRGG